MINKTLTHHDILGNEINPGDKIVWSDRSYSKTDFISVGIVKRMEITNKGTSYWVECLGDGVPDHVYYEPYTNDGLRHIHINKNSYGRIVKIG